MLLVVVEADGRVVVGEQIAQQLDDQALLLEEDRRRPARFHLLADLGPDLVEPGEVADDVLFRAAGGGGADDHAADEPVLLAEGLDDAAQAGTLLPRLDLARHADVVDRRHEDEEAARHGDVRGEPRALGAERLLDHLNEDFLAFLEEVLDFRLRLVAVALVAGRAAAAAFAPGPAVLHRRSGRVGDWHGVGVYGRGRPGDRERRRRFSDPLVVFLVLVLSRFEAVELLDGVDDLRDVEKGVPFEADVNKRGLHAGEDLRDPPLVDVADNAARTLALDEDLDDLIVLEDGDPCVVVAGGDDHLLVHG